MHDLPLITTIAAAFATAWALGLITQAIGLSPIVGYLLAGVAIGPHTPGFVGDTYVAHQLAEVGVMLLMFGVGLHFHLKDLMAVKNIAVPGAVGQSLVATLAGAAVFLAFGWTVKSGLVLGMAMAVASTVVLLRVLMDKDMLTSVHGHVAVGWLIVEDIFTVLLLVLVPLLGTGGEIIDVATTMATTTAADVGEHATTAASHAGAAGPSGLVAIAWALGKLAALVAIVLLAGSRVIPWMLVQVAKLRSRELFTLTVLMLAITVAVGSAALFGASVALGAFLAGMVVGQSPVSHQVASDALPMRDAFAVLFFVSVGMLFDPAFLWQEPWMAAAGLGIVLLAKPLAALVIVAVLGYSARTALTVAIGLGQIGEFSFILGKVAYDHGLLPYEGQQVLVSTAIISITINPILFGSLDRIENWLRGRPRLWKLLNGRADRRTQAMNARTQERVAAVEKPLAVIVGYGPVGRVVDALLRDTGLETCIIDLNMDSIRALTERNRLAVFGDAEHADILTQAGVERAEYLVVTLPHADAREPLVLAARELNPRLQVIVRARYLQEREALEQAGATTIVFEEGEAGIAMARRVLEHRGVDEKTTEKMLDALRRMWSLQK